MKIVVLAGGLSTERDVSINSGTQVCKALRQKGHQAVLLDVFFGYGSQGEDLTDIFEGEANLNHLSSMISSDDPDIEKVKKMRPGDPDCFFGPNVIEICKMADIVYMGLHGAEGENGKIQAAFDLFGIKYTGSGYLGSALSMDKGLTKELLLQGGIPTPKGFVVTPDTVCDVPEEIGYPCVVKPCCGGSSVGVSIAKNEEEYKVALEVAFSYEREVLVEEYIKGREFSAGVIAGKALPIIEIVPKEGFYDYETKYQAGMAEDICPAELSSEKTEEMQKWALAVYKKLRLEVYGRIDFLLKEDGSMYCLEANTLPGMTPLSLLPQEAKVVGTDYPELCETIIAEAFARYEKTDKKKLKNNAVRADSFSLYEKKDEKALPFPMEGVTVEKLLSATGGSYFGPEEIKKQTIMSITIDSRKVEKGSVFIAIKGQRVDGNQFVEGAYEDGALCCISTLPPKQTGRAYIQVESCEQALKDIAECYRKMLSIPVIGISGSVGKTTTKEMIASVVSQKYDTLKTLGNFNNEIGLPLTVFRIRGHHQVAILEMGISDFGEMERLAKIARPDICVLTNIGQCHLENLGTREGILKAKTEMLDFIAENGTAVLNGDDDKLLTLVDDDRIPESVFFGFEEEKDSVKMTISVENVMPHGLAGTEVDFVTPLGKVHVHIPVPGKHMISNAMAATAVGWKLGLSLEEIKKGIESYHSVGGHGHIIQTDALTIMDDCYNANPVSMRAALDVLGDVSSRRIAILGDMFELGTDEIKMHYEIGRYAAQKGIEKIIAIGNLGKEYEKGAKEVLGDQASDCVFWYETLEEFLAVLKDVIQEKDAVLVKASHAMHFEKIVAKLQEI